MKTLIPIIITTIIFTLSFLLYMAVGKIKDLEKAKANLRDENSKLSDALRRKGIQVAQFEKKFERLEKR